MEKTVLQVNDLNVRLKGRDILKNINFSVPEGSICIFIGPNGAGKTTTIKSIMGLYKHRGEISVNQLSLSKSSNRASIGYVPEKENFSSIKSKSFLKYLCRLYGKSNQEFETTFKKYSYIFKLEELENRRMNILSSGQKKKLLIIQALLHNPELVIMDEPTENMDPAVRQLFYNAVIKELHEQKKTIFISTHQLDEISKYANYVIVIYEGQIKYTGPVASSTDLYDIYNQHCK